MSGKNFRAWDKVTKRYYAVSGLEYGESGELCEIYLAGIQIDESNPNANVRKPSEVILEQSTGLKDRNGKEICEGDIIKSSEHIGEVCQQGNGRWVIFCVKDKLHDGDLIVVGELECETYDLALTLGIEYCQVIGNIHENGDLLNVY